MNVLDTVVMQPAQEDIQRIVLTALAEDIGHGDITSNAIIPEHTETTMRFVAREPLAVAGLEIISQVFLAIDPIIDFDPRTADGSKVETGGVLASVFGSARSILAAERVALNLLQRMCGIATETARYVEVIAGTQAKILDTRKTVPGLRALDKYAVRCGGGFNHRMRLDDAILIKDNHIAIVGTIGEAVKLARQNSPATARLEAECDRLDQVHEALAAGADILLLDNMDNDTMKQAVALAKGKALCEASGNVTLETVRAIAETGVDFISVGRLTHSVRAVDIGLDSVAE